MSLFSQRAGLKPASKAIQRESVDEETRNALWSVLWKFYQLYYQEERQYHMSSRPFKKAIAALAREYWTDYFKNAEDTLPELESEIEKIRMYFFQAPWNDVLDFLEFTTKRVEPKMGGFLREAINAVLERESSVYRFVGEIITELTSAVEIEAIDSAIEKSSLGITEHIKKALQFFSDRKKPDFHNSIKESVSAIEAAAREISGEKGATLTDALRSLNKQNPLHPALTKMLIDLYGYAGDEGGVRHANKESGKPVSQAEARLILIIAAATCGFFAAKQKSNPPARS